MSSNESQMTEPPLHNEATLREWLERFAQAVRERDYAAGANLFAEDVLGFGTYADRRDGINPLISGQWQNIWGITRGFEFDLNELRCDSCDNLAWVAVTWRSEKQDADGSWHNRPGRATFAFIRREGRWLAVHSHFSLCPSYLRRPETQEYVSQEPILNDNSHQPR